MSYELWCPKHREVVATGLSFSEVAKDSRRHRADSGCEREYLVLKEVRP